MARETIGLIRRVFLSSLRENVLQKIQNNVTQPKSGFCSFQCQSTKLPMNFTFPELKNIPFGYGQNQGTPSITSNAMYKGNSMKSSNNWGCSMIHNDSLKDLSFPTIQRQEFDSSVAVAPFRDPLHVPSSLKYCDTRSNFLKNFKKCLTNEVQPKQHGFRKDIIVGAGSVSVAYALCILQQRLPNQLCMIDISTYKMLGEMRDLEHGFTLDYEPSAGSKVKCVLAVGVPQVKGQSRLNPVDMTNICWKMSGLHKERVFRSGCDPGTSRFRIFIGENSTVPIWSSVNVDGVRFMDLNPNIVQPNDPQNWTKVHRKVVTSAAKVIALKGHTSWGIFMICAKLIYAVLYKLFTVHPVVADAKGYYNIEDDIILFLSASIGSTGVTHIIKQILIECEICTFHKSAKLLKSIQDLIKFLWISELFLI